MLKTTVKRDGREVPFDKSRIAIAISKAFDASKEMAGNDLATILDKSLQLANEVELDLYKLDAERETVGIEEIQDAVERALMREGLSETAKGYILYRKQRQQSRERHSVLMQEYHSLINTEVEESDARRENANIDGNTPMGTMLKFGTTGAKEYYKNFMLSDSVRKAYESGDIHIHDFDFYSLTTTCCQIDIQKLFENGFSTGHGFLREPQSIASYAALAAIAVQSNQNDQHGGQSIPNFDHALARGVAKTYRKAFIKYLSVSVEDTMRLEAAEDVARNMERLVAAAEKSACECVSLGGSELFDQELHIVLRGALSVNFPTKEIIRRTRGRAKADTEKQTYQAMEGFVHNLNTMHSRAGAQVPFSSINYGTNTTPEGRLVIKSILLATEAGLGNGETPIFPIQIFRIKDGVNFSESDPNYDLFKLALRVTAKRLFPNFSFQDAPFNAKFYDPSRPATEISYMGCRTRTIDNVYDPNNKVTYGRGNLSFTTINLPRIGIEASMAVSANPRATSLEEKMEYFYKLLDERMDLVTEQLLDRFEIQCAKKVKNFPFLMGQGVWLDSDKLGFDDSLAEVLKHGTLSIGFIGLAECLTALTGQHHGEDEAVREIGIEIISQMRRYCDAKAKEYRLNFSLLATPAEGLSGRFVGIDKKKYGVIRGITDKEYYTNSFHIPVGYEISVFDKIAFEAPFHELTNAGHITYVELDGDPSGNLEALEAIVRHMRASGVGYAAINHPIDRDPVCGFSGIINEECPRCGRTENDGGPRFERIRRITGYLVGSLDRFNDAKRAEERNRVKHGKL